MAEYRYISGSAPAEIKWNIDPVLFSLPDHHSVTGFGKAMYFFLLKDQVVEAYFSCQLDMKKAYSPKFAPYSGFQLSPTINAEKAVEFIRFVEKKLREKGCEKIEIMNLPEGTQLSPTSLVSYLLQEEGYKTSGSELHALMEFSPHFAAGLKPDHKRRLKKSSQFRFSWEKKDNAGEVYDFLDECRQERGQQVTMTREMFLKHVNELPRKFLMASLRDDGKLAAAAIIIRVNKNLVYDYTHAHLREYDFWSPVIRLLKEVTEKFPSKGIKMLDLGSSSLDNAPNFGLLEFKKQLGASFYRKETWVKSIK